MSNPTTYFTVGGVDLSNIFQPISLGSASTVITNYTVSGADLNTIFAAYSGGTQAPATNFTVTGYGDLNNIFDPALTEFTTTSRLLTTTTGTSVTGTITSDFYLPTGYSYFNFIVIGGGANGRTPGSDSGSTGGAGSGATISALSIPYSNSTKKMSSITYVVSGGPGTNTNSQVVINYIDASNNITSIILEAGIGATVPSTGSTTGSAGGTASYTNGTGDITFTYTGTNGATGGAEGANGTVAGYTSSGSGYNSSTVAPFGNPPIYLNIITCPDTIPYTLTSAGGGTTQIVSGYGAGGAATPASYMSNAVPYRQGSAGCILYYLSAS